MLKSDNNFFSSGGLPPTGYMAKRQGVGTSVQRERPTINYVSQQKGNKGFVAKGSKWA